MSCLFDSLASLSDSPSIGRSGARLRTVICDYMSTDPVMMDTLRLSDLVDKPVGAYVAGMRHATTWGGALEIKAYCQLFREKVRVAFMGREHEFDPSPKRATAPPVRRLAYNGAHYTPRRRELSDFERLHHFAIG